MYVLTMLMQKNNGHCVKYILQSLYKEVCRLVSFSVSF